MGRRRAAAALLIGLGEQARFITGGAQNAPGGNATISFAGMAAGQLAIIFGQGTSGGSPPALTSGSGWTTISPADSGLYGYQSRIFWKVLSAGDISTGNVTIANIGGGIMSLAYANATSVSAKSMTESGGAASTLVLPGFTLSSNSAGVLALISAVFDNTTFSAPASPGLAVRVGPVQPQNFSLEAADFTTPGDYPEQALTWTGFNPSAGQMGHLLELLK